MTCKHPASTIELNLMRVCHIASGDIWGGAESQLYNLLSSKKYRYNVIPYCILLNPGILERKLKDVGIAVYVIPETCNNIANIFYKSVKYINTIKPNILHSHRYKENIIAALVGNYCNIPIIVKTVYGLVEIVGGYKKIKRDAIYTMDHILSRYAFNATIVVSDDIRNKLKKYIPENKLFTIPNSINIKDIQFESSVYNADNYRNIINNNNNKFIVGTVGRLVKVKGLDVFLRAAKYVLEKDKDIMFVVGGDGPEKRKLEDLCNELELKDDVVFTGFQENIYQLMKIFDLFVVTSLHEGFPTTLLEAIALRIPSISTNVGGIPEIISNLETGILVEPGNPIEIAKNILFLKYNDNIRRKIINQAEKLVISKYTNEEQGDKTIHLYKKMANY